MSDAIGETLGRFADHFHEIQELLTVSRRGLVELSKSVPLAKALDDFLQHEGRERQDAESQLKLRQSHAEFAANEIHRGFPLLHAHALVSLWSTMEALVDDVLVSFLTEKPSLRQSQLVSKIEVPFALFEILDNDERTRYLAGEIRRSLKGDLKRGISRFRSVFEFLGVSVPITKELQDTFFQVNCLRNVLVHRAGRADARLLKDCPWLDLSIGDRIEIKEDEYDRYQAAIQEYVISIVHRMTEDNQQSQAKEDDSPPVTEE